MAHVMKIKQGAVAPMVAHYERTPELERGFVRGNIDPSRTALNYDLLPHDVRGEVAGGIEQHERTAGKAIRKDANVLFDWVVTSQRTARQSVGASSSKRWPSSCASATGMEMCSVAMSTWTRLRRTRTCP